MLNVELCMMKKIFAFTVILNLFAFSMYAQDAQTILDKTTAKIKSSKGINLSFSLTQKDKVGQVLSTTKGILKVKGTKYYIKEGSNEIFCNGTQIWNYDGKNEVTIAKADYDDDELSPQQIITGFNKKDFSATIVSSSATLYQVQLIPVDKRKNFKQVIIFINKTSNLITKAVIIDKSGNINEISFNNISLTADIPDSQFVFDTSKHPGVEEVNQ
jgi:outer membrane lipoprotein carrier protein